MAGNDFSQLFSKPVSELPGVARKRALLLSKIGIETWFDLLTWFPRGFEDWSGKTSLADLEHGQVEVFTAHVAREPSLHRKGRLSVLRTVLRDQEYAVQAVWFNQPWLADRLVKGNQYVFRGKIKKQGSAFSVQNPVFEPIADEDDNKGSIRPVYPLTQGLSQGMMRHLIKSLLPQMIGLLPEPLPAAIRRQHQLCAADYAYSRIHQPESWEEMAVCRKRLAFEELFLLQAGIYLLRISRQKSKPAPAMVPDSAQAVQVDQVVANLPFQLTGAQEKAWLAIRTDLAQPRPMNRLLQGDVGSGKTVVAALAMLYSAVCGRQSVLMAPTAVLAYQHYQTLSRLLEHSGFAVELLTGATPAAKRRVILEKLAEGELKLLVGTHALIEDRVAFASLALAITDEQHRFGVRQRIRLSKNEPAAGQPHVLVMSATPIPRTLALMLYGDLDITLIDQLPAGRKPIRTYTAKSADRERVDGLIRKRIQQDHQVYVVCPMIEESATSDLESAEKTCLRLTDQVLPEYSVGLLHGQMKSKEKDIVMDRFLSGEIKVLVSTTVIEVGVDNPNAVLMVIENAERFGLAQLHQLRGRIGRGEHESICVLLSDTEDELARSRLVTMCQTSDGFEIAEKDLQLRGPGDFFGTRQHGLPPLRLANLYTDIELMQSARDSLQQLISQDPQLISPENQMIRKTLLARYGQVFARIGI